MKKLKKKSYTYKNITFDYIIGVSAKNNWEILFDEIDFCDRQEWIWFHLDDLPSAHVVLCLKSEDTKLTCFKKNNDYKHFIKYGGILCKQNSKNSLISKNQKVNIICTQIKNLKKGIEIGSVIYKDSKKCKKFKV